MPLSESTWKQLFFKLFFSFRVIFMLVVFWDYLATVMLKISIKMITLSSLSQPVSDIMLIMWGICVAMFPVVFLFNSWDFYKSKLIRNLISSVAFIALTGIMLVYGTFLWLSMVDVWTFWPFMIFYFTMIMWSAALFYFRKVVSM